MKKRLETWSRMSYQVLTELYLPMVRQALAKLLQCRVSYIFYTHENSQECNRFSITFIFGGYLILVLLGVKTKRAKP